jgi:hypothetical protein
METKQCRVCPAAYARSPCGVHGRKQRLPNSIATMKLALLMSCATALRLAPTMVLQPRRDLLAGGAAAAASTLLVPEALAKKPLCMPGTNPASALGGPGYTIGILVARCVAINCNTLHPAP